MGRIDGSLAFVVGGQGVFLGGGFGGAGVHLIGQGGLRLGVALEQVELIPQGFHIHRQAVRNLRQLAVGGGDGGGAVLQTGEDEVGGGAVGGVGEVLNVLIQGALPVVDGGHRAVVGVPLDLVGQLRPGILAVVDGDDVSQGDVPLEGHDGVGAVLSAVAPQSLDLFHVGHGVAAAGVLVVVQQDLQDVLRVDIQHIAVIGPGGVGGVLDLNGDGIGVPVAGGVAGLRRHSRDIQGVGIGIAVLRDAGLQVGFRDGLFAAGDIQLELPAAVLHVQIIRRPAEGDILAVPAIVGVVQTAFGLFQFDGRGR